MTTNPFMQIYNGKYSNSYKNKRIFGEHLQKRSCVISRLLGELLQAGTLWPLQVS